MKRMKINRIFSIAIIACLVITSTPLQAIAAEINEERQWQEITTTFEGDQNKNSLDNAITTPEAVQKDTEESTQDEDKFTLEVANEEFKTDRFIVKYKDNVDMKDVVDIPDLSTDTEGKAMLEEISDSIEQNDSGEQNRNAQDESKKLDKIQESIPVEIEAAQLELPQAQIDSAAVVESENIMVFDTKKEMTGDEFKDVLKNKDVGQDVEYIQPDYELGMSAVNDPYLSEQWGHYQMYQLPNEEAGIESDESNTSAPYRMDANVLEAWEKTKGEGAVVALLDTGVETTHVDLQDNLLDGWDFVNDDNSVNDLEWKYDQWHGTHIAGIIAAEADNNVGVAGVAPEAKILPLKIFQGGTAYTSDIIEAINYAEMCGAKIANCSWGTLYDNPALKAAIENSSMVFVCAAGNGLYDTDKYPVYPASYDLENVISVTSIDQDGKLSRFANYGKESVDIAAPGRDIYSTTIDNGFAKNSGTSMSSGYVSGALALLLSKDTGKTAAELKSRIISSGDKVTGLADKVKNGKKLNCEYALSINPLPNFNSITVGDNDPLPEISPNGDADTADDYDTYAENTISIKTPMPTARHGLGVVAVGDKIYAIGGQLASGYSNAVEEYNPKTDTWMTKATMPTASSYFGIAKINDQIYVLGGYNGSYLNIVQVYNPANNTWTTMPSTHNMPVAMKSFAATAYNGKIYVTGGYNGSYLNTIYEYDPSTGAWPQKQSLSYNRGEHVSVEYGGKIYIDGGCTTNGNWFNVEEVYDPSTNQVTQTGTSRIFTMNGAALNISERYILIGGKQAGTSIYDNAITHRSLNASNSSFQVANSMYYSRAGLGVAEVNGKVYMVGGLNTSGILSAVEEIDLGWEVIGDIPAAMSNFTSIECNGKLYLLGGRSLVDGQDVRIKTVFEYNPETDSWSQMADMPSYRLRFAVAVAYGKIYTIGGLSSSADTGTTTADNKVYEFDPVRNLWTEKASISSARSYFSAANYNNYIYIAGGTNSYGATLSNVEVYNPLTDTWQSKQNLPQVSYRHILTVSNNKLLLVGGTYHNVLEYNPSTDSWSTKYSGLNWTNNPDANSILNLYSNIFSFSSLIAGSRLPGIAKYDVNTNSCAYYYTYYMFNSAFCVTTFNNKVYTFNGPGSYATSMIEYRPPVNPWLVQNNNGYGSADMGIGVIGSDIYHIGGLAYDTNQMDSYPTNGAIKFNTLTNSWSTIKKMNYVRSYFATCTINGKIYAAGGRSSSDYNSTIAYLEEYDPSTDNWTNKANIPSALSCMAYASCNGKFYLFGGLNSSGGISNITYMYDPSTNTWTTKASMPTPRFGCGAALLSDGKIYVVGGASSGNVVQTKVEAYDPVTNTWATKQDMPGAWAFSGVTGKDSIYVVGGTDYSTANGLVYEYSPVTNKWFTWPGPGLALYGVGAAISNNGLYVINGKDMINTTYWMMRFLPFGSYNSDYIHLGEESINLSGNLARNYTDMSYTSQGFQMNFSRTYNSRDDRTDSKISKGWTFGFQGKLSSAGNDTLVRLPNGGGYYFRENIDGTYVAKDSRSTLVKQTDGSYIMTTKDLYSYGFNSNGYLTWMKDRNGNTVTITVDTDGTITYITDPVGRQTQVSYSSNKIWRITDLTTGRFVQYSYDPSSGYLSTVTDPMGNVTRYTYNSGGFLTDVKDTNNNSIESFTYYDIPSYETLPKLKTETDALGKVVTYQFDEGEGTVTTTDNNGRQNITWYDKMLYPIRTKDAEGKETHIEYNLIDGVNKYGEERVVIDRRGNATYYDRDTSGNVVRQINPDGSIKEFGYDSKNNLTSEKDELGKMTYYVYDGDKINLLKTARPLNGTDIYTTDTAIQINFAITTNTYYTSSESQTMCGKVIKGLLKTVTDPKDYVTTYTYDANGNVASIQNNSLNETAVYQYNPLGWLKQETSMKSYITQYYYDRNGNVIKKVNHGGETERTIYDNRNRVTQNIKPNQYAAANDTVSVYDTNNILTSTSTNTYSASGAGYRYQYYTNGLLQTETDPLNYSTGYAYDQYGNVLKRTYDNGYSDVYTYDILNRTQSAAYQNSSSSAIVVTDEYGYNITSDGHFEKTRTHHFNSSYAPATAVSKETYDYADRLTRTDNADSGYSTNEYAANGNLSITTDPMGNKVHYTYDGLNRVVGKWTKGVNDTLCSYEGTEYDKNNNVTRKISSKNMVALNTIPTSNTRYDTFIYDAVGRILEQGDSMGGRVTYAYDDALDKVTQRQYTTASAYIETVNLFNHLGKVKETDLKTLNYDMQGGATLLMTTYTFDKEGNILTETKPNNVTTTYDYDLLGRQLSRSEPATDENGQTTTSAISCTYDFRGNVLTERDPLGRTTSYTYTIAGLLLKKTDAKGGNTYTVRTPDGLVEAQVSPKNYVDGVDLSQLTRTTYEYDNMGRAIKEHSIYKDTSGTFQTITKEYTYDKNGNLLTSKDGMGYVTTYTYDGQNRQLTVFDPDAKDKGLSFTTKYTYDGLGRKISEENGVHAVTSYTYNDQGRVLTTAVGGVTTKTCTYDLAGNMLSEADGNGSQVSYSYNSLGKIRYQIFSGDGFSIHYYYVNYKYTNVGDIANITSSIDVISKKNVYTYDNQRHLLSESEMKSDGTNSITKSYRYDLAGNMRFSVDGRGNTTEFTYDALNQKLSQKVSVTINGTVTTQTTTYAYDADGKLIGTTDWLGNQYTNEYDSLGRLVKKKDSYNATMEAITYDNNHRQVGSMDALGNVVTFGYDKANRLISKTDASLHTESKTYDAVGNVKTSTDGEGNETVYTYDPNNRLLSVTNALDEVTSYTYDPAGNLLTQTDGKGNITTYQYNVRNLPTKRIDAGGIASGGAIIASKAETYTYYSDGKLANKTDRNGVVTAYTYDIHGRTLSENVGGDTVSYTYDGNNNQLTMTDGTGTTTRVYDELNRVTSKTVPMVGTTQFHYDLTSGLPAGFVSESYTDPKGNTVTKITDKTGRLYQVNSGGINTTYTYFANGNLQKLEYPNGSTEEYTYYANNKLHTLLNKQGSSTLEAFSYAYDGAGNMTGKADRKGTTSYTYDDLNRLLTVTEPSTKVTAYEYDAAGNRTSETVTDGSNATRTEYTYNEQNRLLSTEKLVNSEETGGEDYSFDYNGNVLSILPFTVTASAVTVSAVTVDISTLGSAQAQNTTGVAVYEYDARNQMVKALEGGYTVESKYNGDGLRVAKTVNGETSNFLYEYDKIILETDGSNAEIAQNIYGTNLINRSVGSDNLYYLYNGHGDVTSLQTADGLTAVQYYYDAFGTITEETAAVNNPFRYAGYEYDDETDLYYLNSRMYDSVTARFMQEDTYRGKASDPLSLNLYTYCANNPVIYIDPDGHIYTAWDKAHGVDKKKVDAATAAYDAAKKAGDTAGMAKAHADAEAARNPKRSSNEVGSDQGYTLRKDSSSGSSSGSSSHTSSGGSSSGGGSSLVFADVNDAVQYLGNVSKVGAITVEGNRVFSPNTVKPTNKVNTQSVEAITLTKGEQQLGIGITAVKGKYYYDFSKPINEMMWNNAQISINKRDEYYSNGIPSKNVMPYDLLKWFKSKVDNNAPWDIKIPQRWDEQLAPLDFFDILDSNKRFTKFVFNGTTITAEELGNITYGYYGRATGFGDTLIYASGGYVAQNYNSIASELYKAPYYGDTAIDHMNIKRGIDMYKSTMPDDPTQFFDPSLATIRIMLTGEDIIRDFKADIKPNNNRPRPH